MKKNFYLLFAFIFLLFAGKLKAQEEKLLYSTDFQNWTSQTAPTEKTVNKITNFSSEALIFKFLQVDVVPAGADATRFIYAPATPVEGGTVVTPGYALAQKVAGSYIELSPLSSVTQVVFKHGATGGSRGFKLWKKSTNDADWVAVSSAFATPPAGQEVTAIINQTNVALKFTNLNDAQNAYLFDLKIYGNYTFVDPQTLTTSVNILNSGTISRSPESDKYEKNMQVNLTATANLGYEFDKWVDASNGDAQLSTANSYTVSMDAAKNIKAVFKSITLQNFALNIVGSDWAKVQLNPEPVNGKYPLGTEVTMTVIPNKVTTFNYWDDNSTALQKTVTINSDVTYTATFDETPFIVGWDFKDQLIKQSKTAAYYSESTNTGSISVHEPNGNKVNWLSNAGSFSPTYPNIRLWTDGANFKTQRRYVQAEFSTEGYNEIEIKSMVSANYQAYSVMTIQYSLDGVTFVPIGSANISNIHNTGWADLNAMLPSVAEGQSRVYIRWIADENSPIINEGNDNDGAALTNVFVYANKEVVNDTDAPVLLSTVPAAASNTAVINGSVVLTFNERVKAGTGNITLGNKVVTGSFGSKTATFNYEKLNYDTEYTLTVPSGALTDMSGNTFTGTTVTFRTGVRTEPTKKLFDAVVAKDGSGNHLSVIEAIAAAPINSAAPWVIFIKNGTYTGHHVIPANKPFIHLIGQSRDGVIITDNRNSPTYGMRDRATFWVGATDCYFENIIIENSGGYLQGAAANQADALSSENDRFAMKNVFLRSFQDTYQTSASSTSSTDRHYVAESRIEGGTDFIYGGGNVFFDRDTLTLARAGSVIVAPSHAVSAPWGYVFNNCIINKDRGDGANSFFGRPWQNSPKAVFLNSKLMDGVSIAPLGWTDMGALPAIFADYGTVDKNGNPVDVSQRKSSYSADGAVLGTAKNSLTDIEAAAYTYENVILRPGDTWDPRMMSEAPDKPSNVKVNGANITWDHTAYARLYIVIRDNKVINFTVNNQYTDPSPLGGSNHVYEIQAASEFGALSLSAKAVNVLPITGLSVKATKVNQSVQLNWNTLSEKGTSHFVIERTVDGKIFENIGQRDAAGESDLKQEYYFTDITPFNGTNFYRIKAVDFDGHTEFSELIAVKFAEIITLTVYPNPVSQTLNVSHPLSFSDAVINVVDLSGKKLMSIEVVSGQLQTALDVSSLSSGVYFLQFINKNEVTTSKFIRQ